MTRTHPSISLVVCDLAGTAVDYGSCAPLAAFVELFARHGVAVTEEEARAPMGRHKRDHIEQMLSGPAIAAQWKQTAGHEWTMADLDALFQAFLPLQLEILDGYSGIIPGALEAFALWRSQGIKIAATTGYNREMTDRVLAAAARQGLTFDCSSCAAEVPAGRPAPWMIYRCMEMAEVYPPSSVLSIGDTIADVASGLNAGVWTVGVAKSGNMMGLSRDAEKKLDGADLDFRLTSARAAMTDAGAHLVVDSVADAANVMSTLKHAIHRGDCPGKRGPIDISPR